MDAAGGDSRLSIMSAIMHSPSSRINIRRAAANVKDGQGSTNSCGNSDPAGVSIIMSLIRIIIETLSQVYSWRFGSLLMMNDGRNTGTTENNIVRT